MIEFEITSQLSEIYDRVWVIFQIRIGVSFAVAALAHFASDKLNYLFALIVIALYVMFALFIGGLLKFNLVILEAFLADLRELQDAGQLLTRGALQHIESYERIRIARVLSTITFFGFFAGVIVYLLHSVRVQARHHARADNSG